MSAHFRAICGDENQSKTSVDVEVARLRRGGAETDLQDEVPVAGAAQAQVVLVQVHPEPGQVLVLPADVCSQDQGAQVPLHVQAEGGGQSENTEQTKPFF